MDGTGELEQNVDLEWWDLRHRLCGVQQLVLGDWLQPASAGSVQVNSFDEFHVVKERAERHEVRKADFVSFGYLKRMKLHNRIEAATSTDLDQIIFDFRRQ